MDMQKSSSRYLIGVDGGATKTIAVIADKRGNLLSRGVAGPSNYQNIGIKKASEAIIQAIRKAFAEVAVKPCRAEIACLGLAGVDSPYDLRVAQRMVDSIDLAEKSIVLNDSIIALFGATLGEPGIIVSSGTGSVAAGINQKGEVMRAGGWGRVIGDEGSGYDIGRRCLSTIFRSFDGREIGTSLTKTVLKSLKLRAVEDLIPKIYVEGMNIDEVADLTHIVVAEAKKGDTVARRILAEAGEELALLAVALAKRLKMKNIDVNVAVSGGVFKAGSLILDPFRERLKSDISRARIVRPRFSADIGAAVIAMREAGVIVNARRLKID